MSFIIRPPDGGPGPGIGPHLPGPQRQAELKRADGPSFARVYELEEARRRRDIPLPPIAGDRIPAEVWDEVESAARLVEDLAARGQRVSFDTDRLTGRVVASLIDERTDVPEQRPLSLSDAVDPASVQRASVPHRPFGETSYGS